MSLMFFYLQFKILDFFRHNDILLHLVSTVLEDKYEIYIENIRKKKVRNHIARCHSKSFLLQKFKTVGNGNTCHFHKSRGKCRETAFPVSLAEIPKKMRQSKSMVYKVFETQ